MSEQLACDFLSSQAFAQATRLMSKHSPWRLWSWISFLIVKYRRTHQFGCFYPKEASSLRHTHNILPEFILPWASESSFHKTDICGWYFFPVLSVFICFGGFLIESTARDKQMLLLELLPSSPTTPAHLQPSQLLPVL